MTKLRTLLVAGLAILVLFTVARPTERASATTFTAVTSGQSHTCAITSGGSVQCWGRNVEGQLGIGTTTPPYDQSTVPLPVCASGSWNGTSCSGGSALTGVYGISQGSMAFHTCATVIWGILDCWGSNSNGQVGNGTSGNLVLNPTAVQCAGNSSNCNSPFYILAGITAVATGQSHTCALDQGGYVWCWGTNAAGELGDGTTLTRSIAKRVCATGSGQDCTNGTLLSGVTAIAVGESFSCALTTSGGAICWGYNVYGQIGDGTTTNRLLPVSVSGLSSGVTGLSAGNFHACAALTTGGVKCWGFNLDGELGDGTLISKTSPVSVCATGSGVSCTALTGVSKVTGGGGHTCVITTTSSVKCWGSQAFGPLGNSVQSYTSVATNPVNWTVPSWGQPQATAVSAGGLHTCSIISTFVECWGWNAFGQVGNGSTTDTATWVGQDVDKDGCTDSQELGPNHVYGGQRDPTNFWDFFDTPNDSRTTLSTAVGWLDTFSLPGTWISVGSTSGFPTATTTTPITLYIDSEKFQYAGQNSTQFLIIGRALGGTVAAPHSAGPIPPPAVIASNWRAGKVTNDDVNRVTARYGSTGDPTGNPLAPPPAAPAYSTAFDRSYVGPNPWNLGPPDGQITAQDILEATQQVGDDCTGSP